MEVSVALCTYNGEKYIEEQLDSILNQTVKPHEIIIFDDGSTDGTSEILKRYEKENNTIKLNFSSNNLGVTKNFSRCLSLCTGKYIFLSDQDDVWRNDKIEKIISCFENNEKAYIVFSNAKIIDEYSVEAGDNLLEEKKLKRINTKEKMFSELLKENYVTGATMAIRRELLHYCGEISPFWMHDEWLSIISMTIGEIKYINDSLTYYRLHRNNVAGLFERSFKNRIARFCNTMKDVKKFRYKELKRSEHILCQVEDIVNEPPSILAERKIFLELEYKFLNEKFSKRLSIILKNIKEGYYGKHSSGKNAIIKDLYILILYYKFDYNCK